MRLLEHQATIDAQVRPGGVLSRRRWFFTSFTPHDFTFAATVVCLELHVRWREGRDSEQRQNPGSGKEESLLALRTSQGILGQYKEESVEARQAWQSISVMLQKVGFQLLGTGLRVQNVQRVGN
ncbi:uncharacterized protein BO97DRAFT_419710 [Aspergillus homomorphus CBS 101889]|uniref:Uncharacterized protein n=1 Tax=Aspergillus homomorphus (strain CBS 101889) TaxID=1450537 RepID=A0A395IB70_ASPHC|nr:hypothetical protein BO97DRAFT_419710 [Aspergillus homomorphus CBS 101889]RAL17472.1 hypothetical protein BO97DRAFT_419710 [Aspergillus homomorphus CBS 101889]